MTNNQGLIPDRVRDFSLLHRVKTDPPVCIQFVSENFSLGKGECDLNLMILLQLLVRLIMFPQNMLGVVLN
jgi:hypothetical protein